MNWLVKQRLINNCMYGTSKHLFETYLAEYVAYTHPLFSIFFHTFIHCRAVCCLMLPSAQTKTRTKTVISITTNDELYLVAFKHMLKKCLLNTHTHTHRPLQINKLITDLTKKDKRIKNGIIIPTKGYLLHLTKVSSSY